METLDAALVTLAVTGVVWVLWTIYTQWGAPLQETIVELVEDAESGNIFLQQFNIRQLAELYVRAALNNADLNTTQKQVDFAVKALEQAVKLAADELGFNVDLILPHIRPIVNGVFSELAERLLQSSDSDAVTSNYEALEKMLIDNGK